MSEKLSLDEILKQAEKINKEKEHKVQTEKTVSIDKTRVITDLKSETQTENEVSISDKTMSVSLKSDKTMKVDINLNKVDDADFAGDFDISQGQMEKTNVIPKAKEKSFFKNQGAEKQFDSVPPEIIEKPATIKSKSKFSKTLDLQEIPTIVAVEELERTRVMGGGFNEPPKNNALTDEDNGQIKLSGFDDKIEEVPSIDENIAEKMLHERRKDKVGKFRISSPNIIDAPSEEVDLNYNKPTEDYNTAEERRNILKSLLGKKSRLNVKIIVSILLGIPLFLLALFKDSLYLPSAFSGHNSYYLTSIIIFAIIMIVNIKTIVGGFVSLFKKGGPDCDFCISVSSILVMVHTILLYVIPDLAVNFGFVLASVSAFAMIVDNIGKREMICRVIKNFKFLIEKGDKYTVENIGNPVDATIISRGLLLGEPILKNSVKAESPTNFIEISYSNEPAEKINKKISFIMIALNLVLFGVIFFLSKEWQVAFNVAVCGVAISVPILSIFATNSCLFNVSKKLEKDGALVCGYTGADYVDDANAMVMEASSLFNERSCDLHGIKTFNGAKIDDAILQTAGVIIKTKSPLARVFDDVIVGKQAILPVVKDVVYEEKMGTSAWIYGKKVLVGTRNLLIHHSVAVPKIEFEDKYTRNGRKALYLAVAGKVWAMFVVSYSADEKLRSKLAKLEKSGITILIKSGDPFINDESLAELFDLPEGYLRVMNSSSGRIYDKYSDMVVEKSPAYIVHNGTAMGFVSAMLGAGTLNSLKGLIKVLISFGSAMGFVIVTLLSVVGGYDQLNAVNIIIVQVIWSIFVLLLSKTKRM